jgi:nucleotide-binding universal stress UspA family protein
MFKDVLLPLDLGRMDESVSLFAGAVEIAEAQGARLHVMTVVPDYGMAIVGSFFPADFEKKAIARGEQELAEFIAGQKGGDTVDQKIIAHGPIYKEIVRVAKKTKCDLIIMGVGDSDGVGEYLVGHNATQVLRHAPCSVMAIRGIG